LAKYGIHTESTGSVTLKFNCVQQCNAFRESSAAILSRKKLLNAVQMARGKANNVALFGAIGQWCVYVQAVKLPIAMCRAAMSNPNGLLSQKLCHYLDQGRTFNDILRAAY